MISHTRPSLQNAPGCVKGYLCRLPARRSIRGLSRGTLESVFGVMWRCQDGR
jgi:hypothetical protein